MKPIIFFAAALWTSLAPLYAKAQCAVQPSQASGITCLQRRAVWERPLNARLKINTTA